MYLHGLKNGDGETQQGRMKGWIFVISYEWKSALVCICLSYIPWALFNDYDIADRRLQCTPLKLSVL